MDDQDEVQSPEEQMEALLDKGLLGDTPEEEVEPEAEEAEESEEEATGEAEAEEEGEEEQAPAENPQAIADDMRAFFGQWR